MKIVVFADVHYFGGDIKTAKFNTEKKLVKYAIPLLDRITDMVNREYSDGDICVNLGDIIQDMNNKDVDIRCLKFMFEKLKNINRPCYSVLGNHDVKMMDSVSEVEDIMGYRSTFSLDLGGCHLVFLTTEVRPELGLGRGGCYKAQYLSDRDIKWLENDLLKNELPAIIFTHYGLAEDAEIDDECLFMKNRAEVKEIIKKDPNILAVFSGHQHITKTIEEDGVKYFLLGSLTGCTKTAGVPDGVYLELDFTDGKLTVNERCIVL